MTKFEFEHERIENERELIKEMNRAQYGSMDIDRMKRWLKDAPQILSGVGLADFDDHGSSGSFVSTYKWQLVTKGLMLAVSNPAGLAIQKYEDHIQDLEDGFDYHPIEVHGLAGTPLPVNFLFILRDLEILKVLTARESRGELVILNPGRLPQLRICGPRESSTAAIVQKILTASRVDTRHWHIWVIDLSSSWISIGKSTAGIEIVTERERAEDLIDELHHDMWRRRKTMELISVDASSEISAAPFLLIINDREPLLRSESSDDELSLNALASKRNIEECIYNLARSQDIGIYVIARDPDSRTKKEIGVSPDEALQCLGLLHE